jgi:hypothetical protein
VALLIATVMSLWRKERSCRIMNVMNNTLASGKFCFGIVNCILPCTFAQNCLRCWLLEMCLTNGSQLSTHDHGASAKKNARMLLTG